MQSWLEGRNWVGKCAQATGMTASLRTQSSKVDSNTWESFTRSELKVESVHQESPRSDIFRKRATKPLLKQKHRQKHLSWAKEKNYWTVAHWSKVLFSDESKFWFNLKIKVPESAGREERHRIQAAWSPVWRFCNQWWFGLPWRLLVLVHCILSSPKSTQPSTRRFWSTLCLHLQTSFMEMLISFSCRTLAPAHTAKWFADHDITVLDNMPDLNPIWNLWDIYKRKMRNSGSNNPDELKAVPRAAALESSVTDWSLPCHTSLMLEFVIKEPRPSTECINEYTLKNLNFSVLQILFVIDLGKYSNILRYWFLTFISCEL